MSHLILVGLNKTHLVSHLLLVGMRRGHLLSPLPANQSEKSKYPDCRKGMGGQMAEKGAPMRGLTSRTSHSFNHSFLRWGRFEILFFNACSTAYIVALSHVLQHRSRPMRTCTDRQPCGMVPPRASLKQAHKMQVEKVLYKSESWSWACLQGRWYWSKTRGGAPGETESFSSVSHPWPRKSTSHLLRFIVYTHRRSVRFGGPLKNLSRLFCTIIMAPHC